MAMRAGSRFGINAAALLAAAALGGIGGVNHAVPEARRDPIPPSSHGKRSKKKRRK